MRVKDVSIRIILEAVSKAYKERFVFRNLSVNVNVGECLVIAGPNGSGKSTVLRLISGLTEPTEGKVLIEHKGKILLPVEAQHLIGLLSDDYELYEELTALENVSFFARLCGLSADEGEVLAVLERVGLREGSEGLLSSFSSGMRQRLKLAFALLREPPVLLLDEPTANLDDEGRCLLHEVILQQKQRGIVALATNDEREVSYADRILRLG